MGEGAERHFGKVCAKHPDLKGERSKNRHCVACGRERNWRTPDGSGNKKIPRQGNRYFGKLCAKHPELKGERNATDGKCVGCQRARKARRRQQPDYLERERIRNRRREKTPVRRARGAEYRARKRYALAALTPAEQQRIVALYAEAARRTAATGIAHHVDHDRPLALGGRHHPDNMNVVPAAINLAKGAKYASLLDFLSS